MIIEAPKQPTIICVDNSHHLPLPIERRMDLYVFTRCRSSAIGRDIANTRSRLTRSRYGKFIIVEFSVRVGHDARCSLRSNASGAKFIGGLASTFACNAAQNLVSR